MQGFIAYFGCRATSMRTSLLWMPLCNRTHFQVYFGMASHSRRPLPITMGLRSVGRCVLGCSVCQVSGLGRHVSFCVAMTIATTECNPWWKKSPVVRVYTTTGDVCVPGRVAGGGAGGRPEVDRPLVFLWCDGPSAAARGTGRNARPTTDRQPTTTTTDNRRRRRRRRRPRL